MMRTEGLTKNFDAEAPVAPHRIVTFGTKDYLAQQASGTSTYMLGVADSLGAEDAGDPLDVILDGIAHVDYGAEVSRGEPLTADADGKAVPASTGNHVVGYAMHTGAAGDRGSVRVMPHLHA
ncbi:MAG: DUF2190 family protein [Halomonas sp.]